MPLLIIALKEDFFSNELSLKQPIIIYIHVQNKSYRITYEIMETTFLNC